MDPGLLRERDRGSIEEGSMNPRLRQRIGPCTMHFKPGALTLRDGSVVTRAPDGQPLTHIAQAIDAMQPGDVLGAVGDYIGLSLGRGTANHLEVAAWKGGQPLTDIAIVLDDGAPDGALTIANMDIGSNLGGIEGVTFCGVAFYNLNSRVPIQVYQDQQTGALALLDCIGRPHPRQSMSVYGGWGALWGLIRSHGRLNRIDLLGCTTRGAQEHGLAYIDNVGWRNDSNSGLTVAGCGLTADGVPSGRTGLQIENRADPLNGYHGGPSGHGPIRIHTSTFNVAGGGGGAGITCGGHLGPVTIEDVDIRARGPHAGICFWSVPHSGLHLTPSGHTCPRAYINGVRIDAQETAGVDTDRYHMAFSGVGRVQIGEFDIAGDQVAIDLDNSYGGGIDNGSVQLMVAGADGTASSYGGFRSKRKMARENVPLTDAQIDLLGVQS